jgi:DNA-binding NarL/FixJ family response regulator
MCWDFPDCTHVREDMLMAEPDIVLMDIEMPVADGISGVWTIKKEFPKIRIIMQTVFDDGGRIFASLQAGAEGYILKMPVPIISFKVSGMYMKEVLP